MEVSPFLMFAVIIAAFGYLLGRIGRGENSRLKRAEEILYAIGLIAFLLSAFF